ncbi:hypothetical protein [Paenibacillus sp. SN-8-1]|uniref:hypothetical protein n=1 Tax=Paenibacillus sp. SN-8-1 TaxID=3435409 RepID=UPI003D9A10F3
MKKNNNPNLKWILVLAVVAFVYLSSENDKHVDDHPVSLEKKTNDFHFTKKIVRLGYYEFTPSFNKGFEFSDYSTSALTQVFSELNGDTGKVIKVPKGENVEVELLYGAGLNIDDSEWVVISDPDSNRLPEEIPVLGKTPTWKIDNNRAIAMFTPSVYIPGETGGLTKLTFRYVLNDGTKGSKTWNFTIEE